LALIEKLSDSTYDPIMISGPFLGRFLSLISLIKKPQYILEIGTFTGYGSICLLNGLRAGGKLITIDKDEAMKAYSDKAFNKHQNIEHILGDASEIISELNYQFDLVFIDAAKRKYIEYFDLVLPKLNPGGIILADNVLWKGKVVSKENDKLGEGLDAFNKYIMTHPQVDNILIPIDDGINMIIKK